VGTVNVIRERFATIIRQAMTFRDVVEAFRNIGITPNVGKSFLYLASKKFNFVFIWWFKRIYWNGFRA
jgi:hypothetical protein